MEGFTVELSRRDQLGKGAAGRYRREGLIPVEVYQKGVGNVSALVQYFQFIQLAQKAKISQVFFLKSEDESLNGRSALVREIQRDHLTGKPIHIDFIALKDDEEIEVEVGLSFVGEPYGVKQEGGIFNPIMHHLLVSCLPKDIPSEIVVEVSGLRLNESIHAGDIPLPEGVSLVTHAEEPVVIVLTPKAEVVETPAEAAVAEGAAAEGATAEGGAAAPAADKASPAAAKGADKGAEKEKK
ncbi:MAG: 50S ribosomal protein L25 [SAR324 cluster bacterium]|uniref:Large ribosomal subunit protein bL25 n=1 Tax=SAR324 cluster bacterium TaxID=2024889 RepID=A0A7X9IK28_9DELT|nr:50S ribosomal protein L25 [SAR324 cluster bacterium]